MSLSVRLDPKTESAVRRLARQRKQTRSAVVREAIAALERDRAAAASRHQRGPWDTIAHLVGSADSGGARLSEETGDRVRALLGKKARARRLG